MKLKLFYFLLSFSLLISKQSVAQEKLETNEKTLESVVVKKYRKNINHIKSPLTLYPQAKPSGNNAVSTITLTDISLGCSKDIWSGFRTPAIPRLDFSPVGQFGLLTMVHPSGQNCVPSDNKPYGSIMVDISKDGGTTWNPAPSLGPMGNFSSNKAFVCGGVIYNPTGNNIPDSAYVSYVGWGGFNGAFNLEHTGSARIYNPGVYKQTASIFGTNVNFISYYPEAFVEDGLGNNYYVGRGLATFNGNYNDTIIVRKGVWNVAQRKPLYTTSKIPFHVFDNTVWGSGKMLTDLNIAANGPTVYASATGCADLLFSTDTLNYLTVWKSIDGGANWGAPYKISVDVNTIMSTTGNYYGCGSTNNGIDGAVDSLGNYHVIITIDNYSNGVSSEFSIITNGASHTKTLLKTLQTTSGIYGTPIGTSDYNRGQIALSPNRDKVFYVWFDTDTTKWQTWWNNKPDAISRTYNVNAQSFDPIVNLTAGTVADGKMTIGFVANWASSGNGCGGGPYKLHLGYMEAVGSATNPFIYHYVGSYCQPNLTGINSTINSEPGLVKIFPNPTSGLTTIELTMEKPEELDLIIYNLLGQAVYSLNKKLDKGEHTLDVNAGNWENGVYYLQIRTKDLSITKKLIKD